MSSDPREHFLHRRHLLCPSVTVVVPPLRFVPLMIAVSDVDVDDEFAIVGTAACAGVATSESEPRAKKTQSTSWCYVASTLLHFW